MSGIFAGSALSSPHARGRTPALRIIAQLTAGAFLVTIVVLALAPWQQSVPGTGRVIAYAPDDREQLVQAPVEGRVLYWYVHEGDEVKQGDPIVDLTDNDPEILERIRRERDSIQAQLDASKLSVDISENRVTSYETMLESAVAQAKERVEMATQRLAAAKQALGAAKIAKTTAELNYRRQVELAQKGLASARELELATLANETATNDLERNKAALSAATADVRAAQADQQVTRSKQQAELESAKNSLASAQSTLAKAEGELARIDTRLARQTQMQVKAPRDGFVLRVVARSGSDIVKMGDTLAVLVPSTGDRAVEIWVDGNDAPLVTRDRAVRLQFEGWPAVQFVGWPSVAVGTFGGRVVFVDSADDGKGKFRVVVVPDPSDEPWPEPHYLRQGVRANGWILLNQVSIGYELWRQFNGFPPIIRNEGAQKEPQKP